MSEPSTDAAEIVLSRADSSSAKSLESGDAERGGRRQRWRAGWTDFAAVFISLLAPLLGGSGVRWSGGIVLVAIGLLALIRPPRQRLPLGLTVALIGLPMLALTGFLPARWFGNFSWRQELAQLGVPLPDSLSPQPWLTGEALILLIAGALWLGWLAAQNWSTAQRQWLARGYAAGVIVAAVLMLTLFALHTSPSFWINERNFGPFPNRNHTANFLAIGALIVAACAQQSWREKRATLLFWIAGLGVMLAAVIVDYSRSGVLILLGGIGLWAVLLGALEGSIKRLAIAASSVLVLGSSFVLFGGATLARFQQEFAPSLGGVLGFRQLVFDDALRLIAGSSWCGIGLANFQSVFPFFQQSVRIDALLLHPESDWLWTASELGWAGVGLVLLGVGALLVRAFPLEKGSDRRLRAAALLGAIAFLVHGFVDVAGHRLGTVVPALLILSLAPRTLRQPRPSRFAPLCFRIVGVAVIAVGFTWIIGTWRGWMLPGEVGVHSAEAQAARLHGPERIPETIRLSSAALAWAPLNQKLYFARATAQAFNGQVVSALGDFRRARRLLPWVSAIPLAEGRVWLKLRPALALPVWEELLARHHGDEAEAGLYAQMLAATPPQSVIRAPLYELAEGRLPLQLTFLAQAQPAEAAPILAAIQEADPELETLSDAQKAVVLNAWNRSGDTAELMRNLESKPGWRSAGWRILARHYARSGKYAAACKEALAQLPQMRLPKVVKPTLPMVKLQRKIFVNPSDFASVYTLYTIQLESGNLDGALDNLHRVLAQPDCPPYFHYLEAELHIQRRDWQQAWNALLPLLP